MKLSFFLTPEAEHKLKALLHARDARLLSTLRDLGVTELYGQHETIGIMESPSRSGMWARIAQKLGLKLPASEPGFRISVTRTIMPFRTEVEVKETVERSLNTEGAKAVSIAQRAIELLGMLVDSQKRFNTTIQRRFILALEHAVAREDAEAVEALANSLHMAESYFLGAPSMRILRTDVPDEEQHADLQEVTASAMDDENHALTHSLKAKLHSLKESKSQASAFAVMVVSLVSPRSGFSVVADSLSTLPRAQAELQQTLANLDSMNLDSLESPDTGSSEDALVIVRDAVKQLAVLADEPSSSLTKALSQLATVALIPLPELRWHLQKKRFGFGSQPIAEILPKRFDVAWELLAGFALMAVAHGAVPPLSEPGVEDEQSVKLDALLDVPIINPDIGLFRYPSQALDALKMVVQEIAEKIGSRPVRQSETINRSLRILLGSELASREPILFLRTSARLVACGGNLLWPDCLALANARARHHRFLDPDEAVANVEVAHDVESNAAGIKIKFSVVQKRVPPRIREAYHGLPLAGRIQVLSELVEFAKRHHTTAIQISSAQIAQQIEMDEDELLRGIRKKTTS
jgi:hypothetical protein